MLGMMTKLFQKSLKIATVHIIINTGEITMKLLIKDTLNQPMKV